MMYCCKPGRSCSSQTSQTSQKKKKKIVYSTTCGRNMWDLRRTDSAVQYKRDSSSIVPVMGWSWSDLPSLPPWHSAQKGTL